MLPSSTRILALVLLAALPAAAAPAKNAPAIPPGPSDLLARIEGCGGLEPCLDRTLAIALDPSVPGATREAAWEKVRIEVVRAKGRLLAVFPRVGPPEQLKILEAIDSQFDLLSSGTDPAFTELARVGLSSSSRDVRLAAARFMATRSLSRITHHAIDAAEADPTLRVAALRAIQNAREAKGTRWVIARAADLDPAVRDQALRTLWVLGPAAAPYVREYLDVEDKALRDAALAALLLLPSPDDYPRMQAWLEKHGDDDPELTARLTRAMAEMEANRYRPTPPPEPPLGF